MNRKPRVILEEMQKQHTDDATRVSEMYVHTAVTKNFAELLVVLAEESTASSKRAERLTWSILLLTAALLFFTAYLSFDTYAKSHSPQQQSLNKAKPQ
jgi:hypothetical protein